MSNRCFPRTVTQAASPSPLPCFVTGALVQALPGRPAISTRARNANSAIVCGRRSDKIKKHKDAQTGARTKIFARIGKRIAMAARAGGSDLITNRALAEALAEANAVSFPKDTAERTIKRACSTDQEDFKASSFEVYAHGGTPGPLAVIFCPMFVFATLTLTSLPSSIVRSRYVRRRAD
jgi:hypothetical protein